jgi:hypothetical protein
MKKSVKAKKNWEVQFKDATDGWIRSLNYGATGVYTEASAKRRAEQQMELHPRSKYRAKEIK